MYILLALYLMLIFNCLKFVSLLNIVISAF